MSTENTARTPASLLGSWTRSPDKAEIFARDTWYLEASEQLAERTEDAAAEGARTAVLLIKPDGVCAGAAPAAVDWLLEAGYTIHDAAALELGRNDIRALWLHQWNIASAERRGLADVIRSLSPSLVLVLGRDRTDGDIPTSVELTSAKGPTDPTKRVPGELRHALPTDSYLLNFVHTPDEPADVLRELGIYFDTARRAQAFERILSRHDSAATARTLAAELTNKHRKPTINVENSRIALIARSHRGETTEDTARRLLASPAELDPLTAWHVLVAGAGSLPMRTPHGDVTLANPGAAAWRTGTAEPLHTRTLDRRLVHRRSRAETFVSTMAEPRRDDQGRLVVPVGAQVSRAHPVHGDHLGAQSGRVDLLQLMETCRQGAIASAHVNYGAPLGHAFIVRRFSGTFDGDAPRHSGRPLEITIDIVSERERAAPSRDGTVTGLDVDFTVFGPERARLATFSGSYTWLSQADYQALRSAAREVSGFAGDPVALAPCTPITAKEILREVAANAVISPGGLQLVVDPSHPVHFDHSLDHVPGMLQLEGARQSALLTVPAGEREHWHMTSIDADFRGFGELESEVELDTSSQDAPTGATLGARVLLRQRGRMISDVLVGLRRPDIGETGPGSR